MNFYGVIAVSVLVAVPPMVLIILLIFRRPVMGDCRPGKAILALGWIGTAVMAAAAIRMFIPG